MHILSYKFIIFSLSKWQYSFFEVLELGNASVPTNIPPHPTNPKCKKLKINLLNKKIILLRVGGMGVGCWWEH